MKSLTVKKKRSHAPAEFTEDRRSAMDRLLTQDCGRQEFFLLFFKLLNERMPGASLEMLDESSIRIIDSGRETSVMYMDNAWIDYSRSPKDRRAMLERFVALAISLVPPERPLQRDHIVAIVKDIEYLSSFKPQKPAMCEHICADLWAVYAEDFPDRIVSLTRESIEAAGLLASELRGLALENLSRIMPEAERNGIGPWYMLTAGGSYTASLLLFDSLWDDIAGTVDGDLVAAVPSRDVLMYTGSNSREGIAAIREHAASILATGNYLISDTLIVRSGGRWNVFSVN